MDKKKGIHAGHRERLKERFRRNGLDAFSEHEALELLLMFAIPQRDVNPLAHEMIRRFGSLCAVLDADESELMSVPGIGGHAALLITLMPQLFGMYQKSGLGERPMINTVADAKKYCSALFAGVHDERFYIICLDQRGYVLSVDLLHEGTVDEVIIYPRNILQIIMRHRAHGVLFAHNHPGGQAWPSQADLDTTVQMIRTMQMVNVHVVDHLIYTKESIYSMIRSNAHEMQSGDSFSYLKCEPNERGLRAIIREENEWVSLDAVFGLPEGE